MCAHHGIHVDAQRTVGEADGRAVVAMALDLARAIERQRRAVGGERHRHARLERLEPGDRDGRHQPRRERHVEHDLGVRRIVREGFR